MTDLRNNLGNRDSTKGALVDIVMESLRWAQQNRDVWETGEGDQLTQFQEYLMDLQDGLEPGTHHRRIASAVEYLRSHSPARRKAKIDA